jgi:hypothetical protein
LGALYALCRAPSFYEIHPGVEAMLVLKNSFASKTIKINNIHNKIKKIYIKGKEKAIIQKTLG